MRISAEIRRLRSRLPLERLVRAVRQPGRPRSTVPAGSWPSTSNMPRHFGTLDDGDAGPGGDPRDAQGSPATV
ncbi:hypothetical protein [Aurantimonas manganoxydans]|uniref:hypothetical protein n=1 Tax=Aurantimonas manganoxydans TaxID=651183 RepID=UPI0002F8CF2C|nr:hypothetical protein [Aurantimonas manganoxydans]